MDVVLKTTGLTKRYGAKLAVNNISMTINRGDIYGFIGKNGAGKTTTMKLILGTDFPTAGEVELFGGSDLNGSRRKTGSLLESPGLYKNCSAKENLKRFSLLCGGNENQIDEILAAVGLSDTGNKKAGAFSLGMKQRLGIAIALLGEPEFLVLDEPINGLDPEGIKAIRDLIIKLNKEKGITFLISSHLIDELAKIVTKYGIINDGMLVEEIGARELENKIFDSVKLVVSDAEKAKNILAAYVSTERIAVTDNTVVIKGMNDRADELVDAIVKGGVHIREVSHNSGSFEEYFIERIGK